MGQYLVQGHASPGLPMSPAVWPWVGGSDHDSLCKPQPGSQKGFGVPMGRGLAGACVSTWAWGRATQQGISVRTEHRMV